jgi:hypothetical protein
MSVLILTISYFIFGFPTKLLRVPDFKGPVTVANRIALLWDLPDIV